MSADDWPFDDPRNVATLTLRDVMDGKTRILLVTHDDEDGMWQFLDGRPNPDPADAVLVTLESVLKRDPSIAELADLPCGWRAWRESPGQPWQREEMEPESDEEAGDEDAAE